MGGSPEGASGTDDVRLAVCEAFVEASHEALFSHDQHGRIVVWNRGAERLFGRHAGDVVGGAVLDLFPEHVRPGVESLFATALGGDRVDHAETEVERSDGMPVPIELSLRPVHDRRGVDLGVVAIARDLTEQRLAQAALAETEARLRESDALAHVGRWLWDVASDAVQWSEEMHRIHGIDPRSFAGTLEAHLAAVHADDVVPVRTAFGAAVETGRPLDVEYRIHRADGEERQLYARAEPTFGSLGVLVSLHGFAQDVTDRTDVVAS